MSHPALEVSHKNTIQKFPASFAPPLSCRQNTSNIMNHDHEEMIKNTMMMA